MDDEYEVLLRAVAQWCQDQRERVQYLGGGGGPPTVVATNGYILEDASQYYITEDASFIYVTET